MDELTFFAELQKGNCWFTFSQFEELPTIDSKQKVMSAVIWKNDICVQRHIFAMIFGSFGYSASLSLAGEICRLKLEELAKRVPQNKSPANSEFVIWLNAYAQYCVLYGTVFAYQGDYISSALYLMRGLKTRAINLFMPYCDFIRCVLAKLEDMPAQLAEYDGCGFSVDSPMGGIKLNGGNLIASAAEMIIPALEGENGEIVLAYNGRNRYGIFTQRQIFGHSTRISKSAF